jgi:flagellar protein FliS
MRTTAYESYLENEVLTADPLKLVQLLYRGALETIGNARRYLASGDIQSRSKAIGKALNILNELIQSLDHDNGGELSLSLLRLYDYVQRLLIDANARQHDAPLAEAERLLSTLFEAWQQCDPGTPAATSRHQTSRYGAEESESCICGSTGELRLGAERTRGQASPQS